MRWNWQQEDWPTFTWDPDAMVGFERVFLHRAGEIRGSLKHVSNDEEQTLTISLMSDEAWHTSRIEGEVLRRDSIQSSIRRHFGLKADDRKASPAEQGIAGMMLDLYETSLDPLDHEHLFRWHRMVMSGRRDLASVGEYRTHQEPMQIVSGNYRDPTVYFEAPPSDRVIGEMDRFLQWFNDSERGSSNELPAITRAGIAHLYFESIHPFEDGNGRIGRAISEKSLSQSLGYPKLFALAILMENRKKEYYAALQAANHNLHITGWLTWFARIVLDAQEYTQITIDFLVEKGMFFHRFHGLLNERQEKVIARIFREGIGGFRGGLSAENYIRIIGTSRATATRDLQSLVRMGALRRKGKGRYTRYYLCIDHPSSDPDAS